MPPRNDASPPDVDDEENVMEADQQWRVSKQIPLALIAVIIGQTFGAAWWAATISGRVTELEAKVAISAPMSERMVKLETKFDGFTETLTEIKNLLRQIPARTDPPAH